MSAHISFGSKPSLIFTGGKLTIWGKIYKKICNWGLTIPQ